MGLVVKYTCGCCNYSTSLMVGCGLRTLKENWMPALNIHTKEVVSVNTNNPSHEEKDFILYSDLTLNKKPFFRLTPADISWGSDRLPTKYNYCPKCCRYEMSCKEDGLFD